MLPPAVIARQRRFLASERARGVTDSYGLSFDGIGYFDATANHEDPENPGFLFDGRSVTSLIGDGYWTLSRRWANVSDRPPESPDVLGTIGRVIGTVAPMALSFVPGGSQIGAAASRIFGGRRA
jgi:hypothetical protein